MGQMLKQRPLSLLFLSLRVMTWSLVRSGAVSRRCCPSFGIRQLVAQLTGLMQQEPPGIYGYVWVSRARSDECTVLL